MELEHALVIAIVVALLIYVIRYFHGEKFTEQIPYVNSRNVRVISVTQSSRVVKLDGEFNVPENSQVYSGTNFVGNVITYIPKKNMTVLVLDKIRANPQTMVTLLHTEFITQ